MGTPRIFRLLVIVGGGALVVVIAALAAMLFQAREQAPKTPPPASTGGLVVQTSQAGDTKLDPKKSLRCFVNGQFEGVETLADCAHKNGVATEALDVGVDPTTGALAAANGQGASLTPLPPPADSSAAPVDVTTEGAPAPAAAPSVPPRAPVADCLRSAGQGSRRIGTMPLSACVQALFSGRCVKPGETATGRWGDNDLRLVPHRVEMADDGHSFRLLAEQNDDTCVIPQF